MELVLPTILDGLNTEQRRAVTAPANSRLQIIAGPGTGKTKVLISRVAYLMIHEGLKPQHIIVTTFTKKAANEMTERLLALLKDTEIDVSKLLIGTFHSICYRIIKIYGKKIGIADYTVADERDSGQILKEVFENLTDGEVDYLRGLPEEERGPFLSNDSKNHGYDLKKIRRQISKFKSSGILPQDSTGNALVTLIYSKYQTSLQANTLLDYDDCLMVCYQLITTFSVLNFVQHVLVDEFQDTNEIQLQLMYEFSRGHPNNPKLQNNVTIVGDPDQSIYAFRDAQAVNFEKMKQFYTGCKIITLTENYRSTLAILEYSESVMRQQEERSGKQLRSQMGNSFKPVYGNLNSAEEEARWICYQIEHLVTLPNSVIVHGDIAVLVRTAFQTRVIENEFVRRRIPYRMVRGKAFWERKEVVTIIDYLRVVANENDRIALLRTLNFPKRGLGEKTMEVIEAELQLSSEPAFSVLESMVQSSSKLTNNNKKTLGIYLDMIKEARSLMDTSISKLFELIHSKSGLMKEFPDPAQNLNIEEVQKQLCEFTPKEEEIEIFIGGTKEDIGEDSRNVLSKFIHSVGFYETEESKDEHGGTRISISTIHGAKGLEWPVVFVPGLSESILPAGFALAGGGPEAVDEERRCFYVATTRAKLLLYTSSYTESEGKWGRRPVDKVSRFIKNVTNQVIGYQSALEANNLSKLYGMTGKTPGKISPDFFVMYEKRLQAFVGGADYQIDAATSTAISGFTSAKLVRPIGLSRGPPRTTPRPAAKVAPSITAMLTTTTSKPLKVMTTAPRLAPKTGKAPVYVRDGINKPTGNRAPPYIPDRRKK